MTTKREKLTFLVFGNDTEFNRHQQRVPEMDSALAVVQVERRTWMASTDPLTPAATPTPPRITEPTHANAYRLLYRGALSLPDSHILLDGLTFAARLDSPSKHTQLLQNPLALALESMRGRPSLRFRGVVKLDDDNLWLDESGGIEMLVSLAFAHLCCKG